MTMERDSLYSELVVTRTALQTAEADLGQLTRENQELQQALASITGVHHQGLEPREDLQPSPDSSGTHD